MKLTMEKRNIIVEKKTLNKLELCKGQNRDGHADIFADAHRCGNPHYPTYVGYSTKYAAHISDRHPFCIRMAIPSTKL